MNIKTFIATAVIALTAACSQEAEVAEVPTDENVAAEVQTTEATDAPVVEVK